MMWLMMDNSLKLLDIHSTKGKRSHNGYINVARSELFYFIVQTSINSIKLYDYDWNFKNLLFIKVRAITNYLNIFNKDF